MLHRLTKKLMGSAFELLIVDDNAERAEVLLQKGVQEIQRIEQLLTEFSPDSTTTLLNQSAGKKAVRVEPEVYALIQRCLHISKLCQGAFDITVGPLKRLYNFKQKTVPFPDKQTIELALANVGYQHIHLQDDFRVELKVPKMHLSFAAVGKGYAADQVRKLWLASGVQHGVINASGDLSVIGHRPDGELWKVGIAHPDQPEEMLFHLPLEAGSVATSGDYEQFFVKDGIRYSHNLNPMTGYPLTGIKSVTIFSPSAELCDALATAVYVMGVEVGLHFINQLPQTHCLIIGEQNEVFHSNDINLTYAY